MNPTNIISVLLVSVSSQLAPSSHSVQISDFKIKDDQCTVLTGAEGLKLANQCSRVGVDGVISTWVPSPTEISLLKLELSKYLRITQPRTYARLSKCYFQFVGFNLKGKRIIYVNSFDEFMTKEPMSGSNNSWRNRGISVCDGGPSFWGVEFDPISKTFSNIGFNGAA
jgi:hypothetical protein